MLRVLLFDRTAPGLRHFWRAGSVLYSRLGRVDASFGAASWDEGLSWLLTTTRDPIAELQYWGHGKWGRALVASDSLDASALRPGHGLHPRLEALRERLAPDALLWLRTCEAFGADAGRDLAVRLADWFGCRVAGHTFVIGALQSGLHGLRPGHAPDWSAAEGLAAGTPDDPRRAHGSAPGLPNTITCFDGRVPPGWFA